MNRKQMLSMPQSYFDYNCDKCMNSGYIITDIDGNEVAKECECREIKRIAINIKNSGVAHLLNDCSLEKFMVKDEWQQCLKNTAEKYVSAICSSEPLGWFYVGGQVGAGKTHLCIGILGEFLKLGATAKYMMWREESIKLKSVINDSEEYTSRMENFKEPNLLYIDDFFKTERGKQPSSADINLAFEIINYRYVNRNSPTIISTEWSIDELMDLDEAVGSRIYQMAGECCMHISRNRMKNYRLGR